MLKKLTIVAFAILALAAFSACDDGGGEDPIITKGPDTNLGIEGGACKLDGTCNSGLTCDTKTTICIKLLPICEDETCDDMPKPAPECAVDADCDAGKLCNSGKCEEIGGGGGGVTPSCKSDSECKAGEFCDATTSACKTKKALTVMGTQGLLLGTNIKYAWLSPITFPDANLKKAVIDAIQKVDSSFNKLLDIITVADCANITTLEYHVAYDDNDSNKNGIYCEDNPAFLKIKSLEGLQYCTGIKSLDLRCNNISDIDALEKLTKLTWLKLSYNKDINNINPLVENADKGGFSEESSEIYLYGIPTNVIMDNIQALEAKGITVNYDGKQ